MIPDPLHPAVVHFPIVLLLLGAPVAIVAVFVRRWHLPWLAALMLTIGAVGASVATWTGEAEEEGIGPISERAEAILEEHEDWGERTRNIAALAAVFSVFSLALVRFPKVSTAIAVVGALTSIGAAWCVVQAGHYGGQLVYQHGVGVIRAAGVLSLSANQRAVPKRGDSESKKKKYRDEDGD